MQVLQFKKKAGAEVAQKTARIGCGTVPVIEHVRLQIVAAWKNRRIRMKSIAAMYELETWQVEDIVYNAIHEPSNGPTVRQSRSLHVLGRAA